MRTYHKAVILAFAVFTGATPEAHAALIPDCVRSSKIYGFLTGKNRAFDLDAPYVDGSLVTATVSDAAHPGQTKEVTGRLYVGARSIEIDGFGHTRFHEEITNATLTDEKGFVHDVLGYKVKPVANTDPRPWRRSYLSGDEAPGLRVRTEVKEKGSDYKTVEGTLKVRANRMSSDYGDDFTYAAEASITDDAGKVYQISSPAGHPISILRDQKKSAPIQAAVAAATPSKGIDFAISAKQLAKANQQVDRKFLNETFFVIPSNDGEAVRAKEILSGLKAPHSHMDRVAWGTKLDETYKTPEDVERFIAPLKAAGIKRVALFELPAPNLEKALHEHGFDVTIIDHHKYGGMDRWKAESSLDQLADLIKWPMSKVDHAISVNDRDYIPGLRGLKLSDDEIRQIRKYDYLGQGKKAAEVDAGVLQAQKEIPNLKTRDGVYILDLPPGTDEALFKEELAIQSGDKIMNAIEIRPNKIGFTGDPKMVNAFLDKIDYQALGYTKDDVVKYGGGNPQASMFFGFKPKNPPLGSTELVPQKVVNAFWKAIEDVEKIKNAKPIDFKISAEQLAWANKQVDHKVLNETFFVIPSNDGEAVRAKEILSGLKAPHSHMDRVAWGTKLDETYKTPEDIEKFIAPLKAAGIKRVALFELPAPNLEKALHDHGFEVTVIDHHKYSDLDRWKAESSLDQLAHLIKWPMSEVDHAISVNDRDYIPGLRSLHLSDDQIRQVRKFDYLGQGKKPEEIDASVRVAQAEIPNLKTRDGVYILDLPPGTDEALFKEELAIQSGDKIMNAIEIRPNKIGFTGDPKMVNAFLEKIDYQALGYAKEDVVKYGGGNPKASMFFGFKPKHPPQGSTELVPQKVVDTFWKAVEEAKKAN